MNTIITFVQKLRLARIVVIFLAGIVLLVSTACSSPLIAKTPNPIDENTQSSSMYDRNENVDKLIKESYKTEAPQGGMNNHQDVDPRQNTSESQAKAKQLIKQAQKNVQQGTRNTNETVQDTLGDLKPTFRNYQFGSYILAKYTIFIGKFQYFLQELFSMKILDFQK